MSENGSVDLKILLKAAFWKQVSLERGQWPETLYWFPLLGVLCENEQSLINQYQPMSSLLLLIKFDWKARNYLNVPYKVPSLELFVLTSAKNIWKSQKRWV